MTWFVSLQLPDLVETKTGEEDEDVIFKMRTKMFRFVEASKEWKERGTGDVRFLRHKENKKIRVLMRAEKTLRVRANHPRQYPPSPCPRSRA